MEKIVIDIYGADNGAEPVLSGVAKALKCGVDFFPVLVGEESVIDSVMQENGIAKDAYNVINTDKYITNNDPPTAVFGGNDDASMVKAYSYLKENNDCTAMLSPGNTGALLIGSICRLGLVAGLKFPALASALPTLDNKLVCLVDCGANTDCTANDLVRFAKMGNAFSSSYCGIKEPKISLLSVGREKGKGNTLVKEAYELLEQSELNFIGNVEGSDLLIGYADVIVSDGFSGNIILKNAEAIGKAAMQIIERLGASENPELTKRMTNALFKAFDFNSQGGATFLGPKKTVVKMHGSANEDTVVACIEQIIRLNKGNFAEKIANCLN